MAIEIRHEFTFLVCHIFMALPFSPVSYLEVHTRSRKIKFVTCLVEALDLNFKPFGECLSKNISF